MTKLNQEEIEKIAKEIHEEDFRNSEAYPLKRWKSRGYPSTNDKNLYLVLDAYIAYLRALEKFSSETL